MQYNKFLQSQSDLANILLNESNDMMFILNIDNNDTQIVYSNSKAIETLGYTLDEMNQIGIDSFREPIDENHPFGEHVKRLKSQGSLTNYALLTCKDGRKFPVEVNAKTIENNNQTYSISIVRDITDRFNYEQKLQLSIQKKSKELNQNISRLESYKLAMDINSIVTISDKHGKITYANEKFYEVTGFTEDEVIGKSHNIVRHPDTPDEVFKDMWSCIKNKKVWTGELKNLTKDGRTYIVQVVIVPILDHNGNIIEYIATRYEITQIIQKQKHIETLAKTDSLTGLYNRIYLNETLKNTTYGSLALVDINRFHEINDFYGESVGDSVIKLFSKILKSRLQDKYMLFHLSGDNFIIFNRDISRDIFINDMVNINSFLNKETLKIDNKNFYLNTTMSLSFDDPKSLLSSVHIANTYAKQNALEFNIYTPDNPLEKEYKSNLTWTLKIKKAIEEDRITVFFQPIVNTMNRKIDKYEALVRMIGEDGEIISPYKFLDKAKKSNQYTQITQIVMKKSFKEIIEKDISCSINLTIEDIQSSSVREYIYTSLKAIQNCEKIIFELVESEGIENFEDVNIFIKKIKSFGCKLAIDDFGTGYSNFEYLLKLNADIIKIDGSLIKEIDINEDYYSIVQAIVTFAKAKNLDVVAEFVSSEAIHEKIKSLGIKYSQGYLFGEPKPME